MDETYMMMMRVSTFMRMMMEIMIVMLELTGILLRLMKIVRMIQSSSAQSSKAKLR